MSEKIKTEPKQIWGEYEAGQQYKSGIGTKGLIEQARINERFFVGDHWHGANFGSDRPLTRRNIIKRIGEYKISVIGSAPVAVNYTAEGVPDFIGADEDRENLKGAMFDGTVPSGNPDTTEISVIMGALSDYYRTTAERVKFEDKLDRMLRNAYISGTGILYTYWDSGIETGLYADEGKTTAIKGDIACEVLDLENVVFGDPNDENVESQPYIIIARRINLAAARRMARIHHQNPDDIKEDQSEYLYNSSDTGEPADSKRVTIITKLWKKYDKDGNFTVCGKIVTEKSVIRPEWDLKIHRYPIAKFVWDRRRSCAYGDSEVTYQVPNQIALNQLHYISVWAMQNVGMPKMVVNGDLVDSVSNDPGEIVKIYGSAEDVTNAIKYVVPPNFEAAHNDFTNNFAQSILSDSGANDAALGDLRPDNATAIVQAREAAIAPMQMYKNRFYSAVEDIARIWADFWVNLYGKRALKLNTDNGIQYMTFDGERYKNLVISAKIDVGASTIWSEAVCISNLGGLLQAGQITFEEYLERLPAGIIPDVQGLINTRKQATATQGGADATDDEVLEYLKATNPQVYERLISLPPEQQAHALAMMNGGGASAQQTPQYNPDEMGDM